MKHQKVAVIVWTIDPDGKRRFLLRHNKPFNGYEDEWTVAFGDVENGEDLREAARREASEEFGINGFEEVKDLNYKIEFEGKYGPTEAQFIALKVKDINIPIQLNEESIGYDWTLLEKVKEVMLHEDERKAFDLIK
ncbi:NUDIX domain-containing protein [Candidatus Woesebacteria bacterium]|nr:NUDIX domain-containing protein [Candidatus Woesebacteria bacterium]